MTMQYLNDSRYLSRQSQVNGPTSNCTIHAVARWSETDGHSVHERGV